jgi:ubiquinol-cytochrome c reductase cytochrome b subunit
MCLQILTGILLGLHFIPDVSCAYYSVMHIYREVYFGWSFRYTHSSGASVIFLLIYIHLGRALYYCSYFYIPNTWFSGIFLFLFLMAIAFMGYVLPWGQMSFWGATVITNILSGMPCLVPFIVGAFLVSNPSLSRFFVFHFMLPFMICGLIFIHFFYLHLSGSSNPLGYNTNNYIPFFPFIFTKDSLSFYFLYSLSLLEMFFGFISLSHPDNAFEASVLVTPLHIVPEWYFLVFYAILKAIPNKNTGFMIMLSPIFVALHFGESKDHSRLNFSFGIKVYSSLIFTFSILYLWFGVQLPQDTILYNSSIPPFLSTFLFY